MTERERLIELMQEWGNKNTDSFPFGDVADYLLANGVMVDTTAKHLGVGDTVYWYNMGGKLIEAEVVKSSFTARAKDLDFECLFAEIGKTVFLTKEEAEQALKGGAE